MTDDLLAALALAIDELISAAYITDDDLDAAEVLWAVHPDDVEYLRACKAITIARKRLEFADPRAVAAVEALFAYERAVF